MTEEKVEETKVNENAAEEKAEQVNKNILNVKLKRPIKIDEALLTSVKLDFTNMTGEDVIQVDEELRLEGYQVGFDNLFNHRALLKLTSRASNIIPEDLKRLHAADYMEVTFTTRNFFLKW